jgi:hypothetical protein
MPKPPGTKAVGRWSKLVSVTLTNARGSAVKRLWKYFAVTAVIALSLTAVGAASAAGDPHSVQVSVGYADTLHTSPGFHPHPWLFAANNSASIDFIGTGSPWDAGALMLRNPSANPVTVDDVSVDFVIFGFVFVTYDVWGPYPLTVPAKGKLILTQTDFFNFDTSEPGDFASCDNFGIIGVVHVTVGAQSPETKTFVDSGQILNTGGIDVANCGGGNEGHEWVGLSAEETD